MMIGLTILAVLTFIAIGEIRKTLDQPLIGED
jgi:Tfp pilus assembly protein PilX